MSKPCEFELVPMKRDVQDSGGSETTLRNLKCETAWNAGETENHPMNQLEAIR